MVLSTKNDLYPVLRVHCPAPLTSFTKYMLFYLLFQAHWCQCTCSDWLASFNKQNTVCVEHFILGGPCRSKWVYRCDVITSWKSKWFKCTFSLYGFCSFAWGLCIFKGFYRTFNFFIIHNMGPLTNSSLHLPVALHKPCCRAKEKKIWLCAHLWLNSSWYILLWLFFSLFVFAWMGSAHFSFMCTL